MNKTQDSVLRTTFFKNVDAGLDIMYLKERATQSLPASIAVAFFLWKRRTSA